MGYKFRPVKDIETGEEYTSVRKAAEAIGVPESKLRSCLRRGAECQGHKFEYVDVPDADKRVYSSDLPGEEWRPVPGYEGLYSASNKGRIRSDKFKNRLKTPTTTKTGQQIVWLSKDGKGQFHDAHTVCNRAFGIDVSSWKPVKCVTDRKEFRSIRQCSKHYKMTYSDYRTLQAGLRSNRSFRFKGKTFELI